MIWGENPPFKETPIYTNLPTQKSSGLHVHLFPLPGLQILPFLQPQGTELSRRHGHSEAGELTRQLEALIRMNGVFFWGSSIVFLGFSRGWMGRYTSSGKLPWFIVRSSCFLLSWHIQGLARSGKGSQNLWVFEHEKNERLPASSWDVSSKCYWKAPSGRSYLDLVLSSTISLVSIFSPCFSLSQNKSVAI